MSDKTIETEFTKTSSKGQIVIPSGIRKKLNIGNGSLFAVTAKDNMIILKKVDSEISAADLKTLRSIEETWKDIEKGNYKIKLKDDFFKEFKEW